MTRPNTDLVGTRWFYANTFMGMEYTGHHVEVLDVARGVAVISTVYSNPLLHWKVPVRDLRSKFGAFRLLGRKEDFLWMVPDARVTLCASGVVVMTAGITRLTSTMVLHTGSPVPLTHNWAIPVERHPHYERLIREDPALSTVCSYVRSADWMHQIFHWLHGRFWRQGTREEAAELHEMSERTRRQREADLEAERTTIAREAAEEAAQKAAQKTPPEPEKPEERTTRLETILDESV